MNLNLVLSFLIDRPSPPPSRMQAGKFISILQSMRPMINSTVILNTGQFKDTFHRGDTKSSLCAQTPKLNGAVALCYQLPDEIVPQLNLIYRV